MGVTDQKHTDEKGQRLTQVDVKTGLNPSACCWGQMRVRPLFLEGKPVEDSTSILTLEQH